VGPAVGRGHSGIIGWFGREGNRFRQDRGGEAGTGETYGQEKWNGRETVPQRFV